MKFYDEPQSIENTYKGTKNFTQANVPTVNATGFGAATDDFMTSGININDIIVKNKTSTFYFKVNNNAMNSIGIYQGDLVVVDRSIKAKNKNIIIAEWEGELIIRQLKIVSNSMIWLCPTNPQFKNILIEKTNQLMVWGVVTFTLHKHNNL